MKQSLKSLMADQLAEALASLDALASSPSVVGPDSMRAFASSRHAEIVKALNEFKEQREKREANR